MRHSALCAQRVSRVRVPPPMRTVALRKWACWPWWVVRARRAPTAGDAGEIDGGDGGCAPGQRCLLRGLGLRRGLGVQQRAVCSLRVCPGPDVNGCTARTKTRGGAGGSRSVVFPMPGGAEGYSPACLQVAVGQPVSFSGDFAGISPSCRPGTGSLQPVPADPNAAVIVQPDAGTWASYTFKARRARTGTPGCSTQAWVGPSSSCLRQVDRCIGGFAPMKRLAGRRRGAPAPSSIRLAFSVR